MAHPYEPITDAPGGAEMEEENITLTYKSIGQIIDRDIKMRKLVELGLISDEDRIAITRKRLGFKED